MGAGHKRRGVGDNNRMGYRTDCHTGCDTARHIDVEPKRVGGLVGAGNDNTLDDPMAVVGHGFDCAGNADAVHPAGADQRPRC